MRTLTRDNAESLWYEALDVVRWGHTVAPRQLTSIEISPMALVLTDLNRNLITNPYRKLNYAFAIAEVLWIWSGRKDLEFLRPYNKAMAKFSDDGETLSGAYGPPFTQQRSYILDKFSQDPNTRRAVLTIWRPSPGPSKDIPCTIMLHFLIRESRLNLIVYMRSNDLWLGFPYDLHTFTTIQKQLAAIMSVGCGTYTHITGSMHLYSDDWPHVNWAMKYPGSMDVVLPEMLPGDLDDLVHAERDLKDLGPCFNKFTDDSWFGMHVNLLSAYWAKKGGVKGFKFPEPYNILRERSREVRAKVGGSVNARKIRGDEGGTPKC